MSEPGLSLTAVQPGDAATWASVIVALIVGMLGFAAGIVGLVIAGLARKDSREANRIAEFARADSKEANLIAREANDISRATVEQANETSDVRWDVIWIAPGTAQVRNIGRDRAHEVQGEVTVDGVKQLFDVDAAATGEGPLVNFPNAAAALRQEVREREEEESRRRHSKSSFVSAISYLSSMHGNDHSVGLAVTWRTALGRPQKDDQWHSMTSVEPE